jgi:phosphohistidine swiveling domain-containing protein
MNEWNDSLNSDYLWSSVNFGEAVTEVMTPLTWSVIQFTLDDWVFLPGMPTVGVIAGRPYLNISIFMTLYAGMRRSRQDLLRYMESTLYMRLPDEMDIPIIPVSPGTLLRGFLASGQVRWKQQRGVHNLADYLATNETWFAEIRQAIQAQTSAADLHRLWHMEIKRHIKNGVWCVLGSATYSADYTLELRRQLEALVGSQDANLLIANISQDDAALESLGPLLGLAKLAQGAISREEYLNAYGHRGPHEFELSAPRPAEDPTWLEGQLEDITRSPVDVEGLLVKQKQAFEAAWNRLQARYPQAARRFEPRIVESAHRASLRELARSAYTRDRWSTRLFALRAGELTGLGERVFFLRLGELLALLSGDKSFVSRIESRVEAYQRYKALPAPPAVIRGPFDPFVWAEDPNRPRDIFDAHQPAIAKPASNLVQGSPGSAGMVEGIVRIIEHPEQGNLLKPGEILVAAQTDIAWTLLFPRAAAVITDIGAPLSHAAIVARELGIPAVVGCGNATTRLHTGDRVRVDGGRGIVEILERGTS